ncbi:hypothetical protein [Streptomyces sp. NBC_01768]|uniref:hypothetical protein n=1 Tax=Streptomyces sp. NBC_01768 TaxID=2975938 RepID=UPI002DD967EE|nr:hypothetical protein [Streptomyces sp. NBC_01768]WSC31802.1 hypothetical protein OG902_36715 [Streptomyces sp. NBC_01768]
MAVRTIKRGESRFYVEPTGGQKAPGVTSVLNMLPKPFLGPWNAKMVAEEAVNNLGSVVGLALNGDAGKKAAIDMLKGAARRFTKDAADLGSDAHDLFERLARGDEVREDQVHVDLKPFYRHFVEFLRVVKPEFIHLEETVWDDVRDVAGSFDAIARIGDEVVIIDWKTTRSGVHEEVALQLKAYASASRIILSATGEDIPIPHIDAAAVLHVRPEGWALYPVDFSDDLTEYFDALRTTFDWDERKRSVIGKPVFSGGEYGQQTGTQRRSK